MKSKIMKMIKIKSKIKIRIESASDGSPRPADSSKLRQDIACIRQEFLKTGATLTLESAIAKSV